MSFCTNKSKLRGKVGGGILCKELSVNLRLTLPDYCNVFQAEVTAIKETA